MTGGRALRPACGIAVAAAVMVLSLARPAAAQDPAGPRSEGIKVHGHWTLVIRNGDGTVVSRHEFENALLGPGGTVLAQLLAGTAAAGPWLVFLHPEAPGPGCNPVNNACSISGPNSGLGTESHDLTVSVPTSGPNAGKLVLRGSVRIPTAQAITEVGTNVITCPGATAAASCIVSAASGQVPFTGRGFAPIPVAADQTVDVTVVISFS